MVSFSFKINPFYTWVFFMSRINNMHQQTFWKNHCTYWPNYPHLKTIICMLLYVIHVVPTELMIPLLPKLTVSFDARNAGKNLCSTETTQEISSESKCGHPDVAFPKMNGKRVIKRWYAVLKLFRKLLWQSVCIRWIVHAGLVDG